jgi:hypothetical protein
LETFLRSGRVNWVGGVQETVETRGPPRSEKKALRERLSSQATLLPDLGQKPSFSTVLGGTLNASWPDEPLGYLLKSWAKDPRTVVAPLLLGGCKKVKMCQTGLRLMVFC